jgi:hypothetical protein
VLNSSIFSFHRAITSIAFSGSRFVIGASAGNIAYSDDGLNWTKNTDLYNVYDGNVFDIAYGGNRFIAVGSGGDYSNIWYSNNQ